MFGMGGSEILVILVVALLFLGPDKLPEVTKTISKGIRDLKKQSRALQQTIENDEHIGGAIRDLKSALRGDELPVRPPVRTPPPALAEADAKGSDAAPAAAPTVLPAADKPALTLPATAGEPGEPGADPTHSAAELAAMIRPAAGTVAKGSAKAEPPPSPPLAKVDEPGEATGGEDPTGAAGGPGGKASRGVDHG